MKSVRTAVALVLVMAGTCSIAPAQKSRSVFDAPIIIQVDDRPLNLDGEILYPSPSIFDVDSDGKDELVLGSLFGFVYACENQNDSKGDPTWARPRPVNTRMEQPLELNNWCCVGMSPQLVDINADGMNDMIMATFEGSAFIVEGTKDGFKSPRHILDSNEEAVRISMYWDDDEEDYFYVNRSAQGEDYVKEHHLTSAAAVDWDEDGDLDLLLGAYEGALYLCLNEGTEKQPRFADTNLQVKADGKHIIIKGGLATPRVCDWNQDGKFDILCGGSAGGVFFFKNIGDKGAPKFAASQTLIEQVSEDAYALGGVPTKDGLPIRPDRSFHIEPVDYDRDGDLDMLVGSQTYYAADEKQLSADEKDELADLNSRIEETSAELTQLFKDVAGQPEKVQEMVDSEKFNKIQDQLSDLMLKKERLSPSLQEANLVWLFRNNGGEGMYTYSDTVDQIAEELALSSAEHEPKMFGGGFDDFDEINQANELTVAAEFLAIDGNTATLEIQINVPEGYHIYGAKNQTAPTQLAISETGALEMVELAKIPKGRIRMDKGKRAYWLEGTVTLQQKLQIPEDFSSSATVEGHIEFMMCNDEGCDPPKKVKFSATLNSK